MSESKGISLGKRIALAIPAILLAGGIVYIAFVGISSQFNYMAESQENIDKSIWTANSLVTSYLAKHPTADNLQWEFEHGKATIGTALGDDPDWVEQVEKIDLSHGVAIYIQRTDSLTNRSAGTWEEYTILLGEFTTNGNVYLTYKYSSATGEVTPID